MANNQITQTVSPFIESQVPEFLRAGSPQFVAFLKAYYEWMEQGNNAIVTDSFELLSYKDIDTTTDQFIQFFINDFLPYFPNDVALDERKLIKVARDFYKKKGSIESIQFLFRVLFNKEAVISFPADNILRTSAGKWILPQALTLLVNSSDQNFDVSQLVGRQGVGSISNATCVIESATLTVDAGLGIEVLEIFVSNLVGAFSDLENLNIVYGFGGNGAPIVFTEKIIASISSIQVDPNNRGLKYQGTSNSYPGDPVVISGGLQAGDTLAAKAVGFVGNVTSGSITGVIITKGGFNYRIQPNTQISVINAPGDTTGTGANVVVDAIDSTNSVFVLINTDAITLKAAQQISSANYGFANIASANQNTTVGQAFTFANLQFAPIQSMNVINGGGAYTQTPSLSTQVTYYTDYTNQLVLIPDPTDAANSVQFIDDLGFIANVTVINGGSGYDPTKDVIVVPSSVGYGANFSFTVSGTGAINSVTVNNSGQGYFYLPYNLAVANSANTQNAATGTGATLTAYGFGQGAQIALTVNKIGQILDIRLTSRGFDYVSTPNVSLRVEDLKINDPGHNLSFGSDTVVFQGANANSASYRANIDSYNVSSQILRLYNYQGSYNAAQNLVTTTGNVTANANVAQFLTVYGDGKAKANAIFLNGLIDFPGYFQDTSGFLSSDQKLQGSNVYHAYSYVVSVEQALNDYKKTLMQLVHPSGMSLLGRYIVQQYDARNLMFTGKVSVDPVVSGSVSANAFAPTGLLVGSGTQFSANATVGDKIIFNISDSTRKLQVKEIKAIANAGNLTMDSNTVWIFEFPITINTAANTMTSNLLFGNVAVNDIVQTNVAGNAQTSIVQTTSAGSLTVNTVFSMNASNVLLLVFPSQNAASYKIVKAAN
jgi:hypothetical protein